VEPDATEEFTRSAGTHINRVSGCKKPGARRRKAVVKQPDFAVALSGGGFRASLAGVGVLRFFASADLLSHVSMVSSVSGGSITNGLFAMHHRTISDRGFSLQAFDDRVTIPLLKLVTSKSMTMRLVSRSWRAALPGKTRTEVLADVLDDWFFH
jgi:NTE family protein